MNLKFLYNLIIYLSAISVLIPLVVGLIKIRTLSYLLRVLFVYICICSVTEILCHLTAHKNPKIFHLTQNLFTVVECLILLYIFVIEFSSKTFRVLILTLSSSFLFLNVAVYYWFSSIFSDNNIASTAESIVIIFVSLLYFYNLALETKTLKRWENSFLWINIAVLLYFSTSFCPFLFSKQLANKEAPTGYFIFQSFQRLINIIYNTMLAVALWKPRTT